MFKKSSPKRLSRNASRKGEIDQLEEAIPCSEPESVADVDWTFSAGNEVRQLARLGIPAFFQGLLTFGLTSVVYLFLGRLGAVALSSASLASSVFYLTGASIACELSMGIQIISGQAYGAGNPRMVQLAFYQGLAISLFTVFVISLTWRNAEKLFLFLGQNPVISQKAAVYLNRLVPYLFADVCFTCLSKSLASRGVIRPTMVACGSAVVLAPALSWYLIFKSPLGLYGAPMALSVIGYVTLTLLSALSRNASIQVSLPVWRWVKDGWTSMPTYLSVTLPGLAMILSEWWAYEFYTVLAGLLPHPEIELGIMGISNSLINILFVVALATEAGVIARLANLVGAGQKLAAIASARTALVMSFVAETLIMIGVCLLARPLSHLWFPDERIAASFISVLPIIALTEWGSGMSFVVAGILRACNRSTLPFVVNFVSHWVVGVPLGCFLGFRGGLGVTGFWSALATVSLLQLAVLLYIYGRIDFDAEIQRAKILTAVKPLPL